MTVLCLTCSEPLTGAQCAFCGSKDPWATSAKAALKRRQGALQDVEQYRQFIRPSGHLDFTHPPARHHKIIQDGLNALIDGHSRRLMIFCPPGAAKSTYSSIQAVTYFMAREPQKNVLCCSNTQDLAEAFNRRRRMVIETEQWQELSGTSLDPNNKGVKEFGLLAGGLSIAAGQGGSITGKRSDFNVADDLIVGHEQANSPTQLDKMWNWWMADFRSRLKPHCPELVIMTRWSSGDIAGRLLDSEEAKTWDVIRLPMECDDEDNDPMNRQLGEQLWPEWYEQARIDEFKRNPRDWISLFQQRPVDEKGSWCPPEHIHITDNVPAHKHLKYVIGVDLALSVGHGDYTVFAVIGIDADRDLWLVDLYRKQVSPDVSARDFMELVNRYSPLRAVGDDDNATKVWQRYVLDLARSQNLSPPPLTLRPMRGNDKEVRAAPLRGYLLSDRFHVKQAAWSNDVYSEFLAFPSSAINDDIVDACGLGVREAAVMSAPSTAAEHDITELGSTVKEVGGVPHLQIPLNRLFNERDSDVISVARMYRRW